MNIEVKNFSAESTSTPDRRDIFIEVRIDVEVEDDAILVSIFNTENIVSYRNNLTAVRHERETEVDTSNYIYIFQYEDDLSNPRHLECNVEYRINVNVNDTDHYEDKRLDCSKLDEQDSPPEWRCPDVRWLESYYDPESRSLTASVDVTVHDVPVTNACLYLTREGDATNQLEPLCTSGTFSDNFILQGSKTIQNPGTYILIFKHDHDSCGCNSQTVVVPAPETPTEPSDDSHSRERTTNDRHRVPFLPKLTLCSILEFLWTTGAIALIVGSFLAFASILGVGLSTIEVVNQPNTWYNWLLAGIIQAASAFLAGRWLELFIAWVIIYLSWFVICKPSYCRILGDWKWVFGWALVPLLIIEAIILYLLQAEGESGNGNFAIIISLVLLLLYIEAIRFIREVLQRRINEKRCTQLGIFDFPWNREK